MSRPVLFAWAILFFGLTCCSTTQTTSVATVEEPIGGGDGLFINYPPGEENTEEENYVEENNYRKNYNNDDMTRPENNPPGEMLQDMNHFSLEFFRQLSEENPNQSMAFSPASLNMAMAIVYSGAREETQKQMSKLLGFSLQYSDFHPAWHAYFSEMQHITRDTLVDFNLANKVFLEQSYEILTQYKEDVETWHNGAFEKTDFLNHPREAEQHINSWVEDLTRNRIQDLIPSGTLSDLTRLVLVNAMYIKSDWKHPFKEENTREKMFRTLSGEEIPKDFMIQRQSNIPWYEGEDFTALELPYTTPELSLILIKPHDKTTEDLTRFIPDVETYNQIIRGLRQEEVEMEIPSFKLETAFTLSEPLREAGLEEAFDQRADFSGISGRKDLHISDVLQKVFFEIDEKGSEAAAATAVVVVTTSMPVDPPNYSPKQFVANHPFIFILKENKFNTPLFTGKIVN